MNEQPTALRLADLLQDELGVDGYVHDEAAAELRRLHEEVTLLREQNTELDAKLAQLEEANQGLLEALTSIAKNGCCDKCQEAALVARAAIAKHGGAA